MNDTKLNRVLLIIIAILLVTILIGTGVGLFSGRHVSPKKLISQGKAENLNPPVDTTEVAYFDLGSMRVIPELAEEDQNLGTVMVIRPWLAYPAGDTVFFEELARKSGVLKSVFTNYFSKKTKNEILSETEEKITTYLIEEINKKLSLGVISNIFFTDYIFLE